MKKRMLLLAAGICLTFLFGCASEPDGYPSAYRDALPVMTGIDPVPDEYVDRFFDFFSSLDSSLDNSATTDTADRAAELYSDRLYFSDALMHTYNRDVVVAHFQRMSEAGMTLSITEHNRISQGQDVYLIWSMNATFRPIRKPVSSDTLGMTHLRFDQQGRIVLQQDFWDTGLGFYSKVPVLGPVVRAVGARFSSETQESRESQESRE